MAALLAAVSVVAFLIMFRLLKAAHTLNAKFNSLQATEASGHCVSPNDYIMGTIHKLVTIMRLPR